ncbi:MAG TPA: hypothetical protein ACFYDZ_05480 [Candidatus Brocadiaceae bacterium]
MLDKLLLEPGTCELDGYNSLLWKIIDYEVSRLCRPISILALNERATMGTGAFNEANIENIRFCIKKSLGSLFRIGRQFVLVPNT